MHGTENRKYPRAREETRVRLFKLDGKNQFEAYLDTSDVSFGGAFFTSKFFLKPGMDLEVEFTLPHDDRTVHARGIIVREVRVDGSDSATTGFAVRFVDYFGDSKSILATYFLHFDLDDFLDDYMQRRQRRGSD
ncbi:MAG: PilZ domain-containing protein, partial [Myxococcota bacterium]